MFSNKEAKYVIFKHFLTQYLLFLINDTQRYYLLKKKKLFTLFPKHGISLILFRFGKSWWICQETDRSNHLRALRANSVFLLHISSFKLHSLEELKTMTQESYTELQNINGNIINTKTYALPTSSLLYLWGCQLLNGLTSL